jgi:L-threonylcarbamoyladenylate synthase
VAIDISPLARALVRRFWPGPLTLVLRRGPAIAAAVSAGRDTVAVRMPDHPVALGIIRAAGLPVAAPSANRFTRTSATTAAHVLEDLDGRIEVLLDGGPTRHGMESTVLDATGDVLRLLRPGAVTAEAIEAATGKPLASANAGDDASSPGMLAKHYAPRTPLRFIEHGGIAALVAAAAGEAARGRTPGVLCLGGEAPLFAKPAVVEPLGDDLADVAHNLYAAMRRMDARGVDVILVRDYGEAGLGRAIRDRLRRAAAKG